MGTKQLLTLYANLKKEAERCKVYAMRAKKDDLPELSLLLHALALSHNMQARRFLMQLRGSVGTTEENIRTAITEEIPGFIKVYGKMLQEASQEGSRALETGFLHSSAVQQRNIELYDIYDDADERESEYFVCDFCGYIAAGEAPDNCPVCTAPKKRFVRVNNG